MADVAKLVQVKNQLADKYEHRAKIAGSVAKRRRYQNRAEQYRQQARMLQRPKPSHA